MKKCGNQRGFENSAMLGLDPDDDQISFLKGKNSGNSKQTQ